jgi:DNA-binding NarL/FixJ family response regulator
VNKIRVLLADDQVLFLESLRIVIQISAEDIDVVGTLNTGKEALDFLDQNNGSIDVILLDVRMPEMDGVETAKIIHEKYPLIHIIMLTTFDDDDYVYRAIRNGATGYLLKELPPEELIEAIRIVAHGQALMSPSIASKMADSMFFAEQKKETTRLNEKKLAIYGVLTKREREILTLIADGLDNREIADKLFIAEQTVKNHISDIHGKFGVNKRLHLIRIAKNLGFSTNSEPGT